MLNNVFALAEYNPIHIQMILETESLFERNGMVKCGRLDTLHDADMDEYTIDPLDFDIRSLYDRRIPKTHHFAIFNVKLACPIPINIITKLEMNKDDDLELFSPTRDYVTKLNRSRIVQMKLRPMKFEVN